MSQDNDPYDLRGLKCPLPVLRTRKRLNSLGTGAELVILTNDPLAKIDIPHFCREEGHDLLSLETEGDTHRFHIRRGPDRPGRDEDGF